MFTGIIQDVGRLEMVTERPDGADWLISTRLDTSTWQEGDSVSVDGCCLTITSMPEPGLFTATLSPETLARTRFFDAKRGWPLNLESALRVGDALGGHWVTGHIDDMAKVTTVQPNGEHVCIDFTVPASLACYVVAKGSVTINGVSLTVNEVDKCEFSVNLIPHTLENTNLDALRIGDRVNLETDILARYVERLLQAKEDLG